MRDRLSPARLAEKKRPQVWRAVRLFSHRTDSRERDGLQWLQLREFIVVPRTRTYPRERGSLRVRDNICLVLERVSANHAREMRSNIARWTVGNVCARINVIPTRIIVATSWQYISYRCFRYNNFFLIRYPKIESITIELIHMNIIYFWGYVVISRWQMKTCWFNLRSFYIMNVRLYILNLNLFQKLNHYNNIVFLGSSFYLSIIIWSVA